MYQIYAKDTPKICQRYAIYLSKICQTFAKYMPKIFQRHTKDMPKICQRYAKYMSKIFQRYAEEEAVCGFILMLYKLRPLQSKFYERISEETLGKMKEKEIVDENEEEEGRNFFTCRHRNTVQN